MLEPTPRRPLPSHALEGDILARLMAAYPETVVLSELRRNPVFHATIADLEQRGFIQCENDGRFKATAQGICYLQGDGGPWAFGESDDGVWLVITDPDELRRWLQGNPSVGYLRLHPLKGNPGVFELAVPRRGPA